MEAVLVEFVIKWNGKELPIAIEEGASVADLKQKLQGLTNVLISKQKLLGLKDKGKPATDESKMVDLKLTKTTKIMMMGTPEEQQLVEPEEKFDILDDFEYDPANVQLKDREENIRKIQSRITNLEVKIMNAPRQGKPCLVLDIDYTLFDHRSPVESTLERMRPYLHEFLTAVYPHYDIVLWSATTMKWIDLKMKELGVFDNPNYKITFCLDRMAMVTVAPEEKVSSKTVFDTKGLAVIWGKFPEHYSSKNTIHFDDLRRNFILNPQNGLRIKPFRNCALKRATDDQLIKLTAYLIGIKDLTDFSSLNHDDWKLYCKSRGIYPSSNRKSSS